MLRTRDCSIHGIACVVRICYLLMSIAEGDQVPELIINKLLRHIPQVQYFHPASQHVGHW